MGSPGPSTPEPPQQDRSTRLRGAPSAECLGLHTVYSGSEGLQGALVDVIAVHGIGAHPEHTWRTQGVDWLSDPRMLPEAIPHARIMRYGYASQWFGENTVRQRLSGIARDLLRALRNERSTCETRPLVMLGHCYGGLVIQKATVLAKMEDNRYPGIGSSISGFVFLGTPHRGTGSLTSEGLACAVSRENPDLYIDTSVLQTIKAGSGVTTDLLREFTSLCTSTMTPICCFFEQQRTKVGRIIQQDLEEFVVDEKSACIDGCLNYGLSVNHFRLNKFATSDDACYKAVAGEIQQFVREAPHRVALRRASVRSGDFSARLAQSSDMASASNTSHNNPQAAEALRDQKPKTAKPATSPMPVGKLLESLEAIYNPKNPPAAVKRYRSPKTGRHLRSPAYRTGDKVGFKRAYIATWASGEGTYDPYYVCNVSVNMSDKYIYMVAPALDGIDGEWVVEQELQHFKELET